MYAPIIISMWIWGVIAALASVALNTFYGHASKWRTHTNPSTLDMLKNKNKKQKRLEATTTHRQSTTCALPDNLVLHIGQFLRPASFVRFLLASKKLSVLLVEAEFDEIWRSYFLRDFGHPHLLVRGGGGPQIDSEFRKKCMFQGSWMRSYLHFAEEYGPLLLRTDGGPTGDNLLLQIHGIIYDVSSFLHAHPGGAAILLDFRNSDASGAFELYGHSIIAQEAMKQYQVFNRAQILGLLAGD
jgi:hypothetical protein